MFSLRNKKNYLGIILNTPSSFQSTRCRNLCHFLIDFILIRYAFLISLKNDDATHNEPPDLALHCLSSQYEINQTDFF